jgi:hypothetical protein
LKLGASSRGVSSRRKRHAQSDVDSQRQHRWHEHIPRVGQRMRQPLDHEEDTEQNRNL